MNRRDFILLRTRRGRRTAEVDCQRLYMRFQDARTREQRTGAATTVEREREGWDGEPPAALDEPTVTELLRKLERGLEGARVVRLIGPEWLADDDLRAAVESVLDSPRSRGARIVEVGE